MADNTPLSEWSGSGATRELHETVKLQIAATDRQSKIIHRLTVFMAFLAFVQTVATVVQVIPIAQNKAASPLPNPASELNKQESKPPLVTHKIPPTKK